jgi:hypothetical protein
MMNFTDITGLAGVALAIVTLTLRMPFFACQQLKLKIGLAAGLVIALAIPFDGLSAVEFVRGILGDLSITTLLLLGMVCCRSSSPSSFNEEQRVSFPSSPGIETEGETEEEGEVVPAPSSSNTLLLLHITLAAFALYPFALGIGTFDPYRLGFGNVWFIAGLLVIALAAWLRQYTLIALSISLAVLAWNIDWYESNNLWNYLLDPWVVVYALVALLKKGIGFVSRSKSN